MKARTLTNELVSIPVKNGVSNSDSAFKSLNADNFKKVGEGNFFTQSGNFYEEFETTSEDGSYIQLTKVYPTWISNGYISVYI